jgi:hypothetical protein
MMDLNASLKKYRLLKASDSWGKNQFPREQPIKSRLETYFQTVLEIEPFPAKIAQTNSRLNPDEYRRHVLDDCLSKLSAIEIDGTEHIEEYLRYQ